MLLTVALVVANPHRQWGKCLNWGGTWSRITCVCNPKLGNTWHSPCKSKPQSSSTRVFTVDLLTQVDQETMAVSEMPYLITYCIRLGWAPVRFISLCMGPTLGKAFNRVTLNSALILLGGTSSHSPSAKNSTTQSDTFQAQVCCVQ